MTEKTNNESEQKVEETNKVTEAKSDDGNSEIGKSRSEELGTSEEITIAERIEAANLEMKKSLEFKAKLLEKEEKILARQEVLRALGGGSPAGQQAKPAEKTSKQYAEEVMTGKIKAQ